MKKIKVYDQTVFYACKDGYASTLAVIPPKGKPATLSLSPLPLELHSSVGEMGPCFRGLTLPMVSPGSFSASSNGHPGRRKRVEPGNDPAAGSRIRLIFG